MAVWSSLVKQKPNAAVLQGLKRLFDSNNTVNLRNGLVQQIRWSGGHHREMYITPSRFQWNKTKDLAHFYTLLGAIPACLIIFYCNVFIGPATLTPTPENYTPKHWEYHRVYEIRPKHLLVFYALYLQHPITRFIARYILPSPQQEYEKVMHTLFEEEEKKQLFFLEKKVMRLMSERSDYQSYYYNPNTAIKYYRAMKEVKENNDARAGDGV